MTAATSLAWRIFPLVRRLSNRLSPLLLGFPITPNQVTAVSLASGLAGGVCFAFGGHTMGVIGALLIVFCYVLDNCDGDIARAKKLYSRFGHYFDSVADWLVDLVFFLCLGIGASAERGEPWWLWLGIIAAGGATLSYVLELRHDMIQARNQSDAPAPPQDPLPTNLTETIVYIFRELTRADFCFIILLLSAYDVTWVLLPLGAAGAQAYWLTSLFVSWRRFHV